MNALPASAGELAGFWRQEAPAREALRHRGRSWTWAQLAARVDSHIAAQAAAGLRPGDRVAVLARNHPVQVETVLACLQAGTVMTPVSHLLAAEQVRHVLADARARLLIAGAEFRAAAAAAAAGVSSLQEVIVAGGSDDEYEQWLAGARPARLPRPGQETCIAQFYTSGTTGFPKGAMLSGANLTAAAQALGPALGFGRDTAFLSGLGVYHVATMGLQVAALYHGGSVVVPAGAAPRALLEEIVREQVTDVIVIPPVLGAFLEVPGAAGLDYSRLRNLIYTAAPIAPSLLRRCLAALPVPVAQGYGLTETTCGICVLSSRDHRDDARPERLASVGQPVPGAELAIADVATGEPLGAGEVGEVRVRSRQVMLGYWDGAGPDTSAITPDGWLRTGDTGYLDQDGYLYLTGRLKDMYISDGHNVYAAVVERVLISHPHVAEAAVIGVPDSTRGEAGVAFVVPAAGADAGESAILRHCREHLADYQCPDRLVILPALPRNELGKVVKEKLRGLAVT